MGQICSGQKGEQSKESALSKDVTPEDLALLKQQQQYPTDQKLKDDSNPLQNQSSVPSMASPQPQRGSAAATPINTATSALEKEQLKVLQQEQQRLDMIVASAAQGMISVRSTRGSTGYYDQGFAAALAQHLEQTTSFPDTLPLELPKGFSEYTSHVIQKGDNDDTNTPKPSASSLSVYACLSRPQWEGILLGTAGSGLAGCGGENPQLYMDNVAESLLETCFPAKQHNMFVGVKPMVENLM
ncbi:hypothetical protein IV203_015094 [Nitzschia inconspicua]|uniref:Uncharacterized protein n=1 Tax=Nitzschia inconspicua TaxID=303405 RepID=A0A9K3LA42_9STRA|nr:hypothetical protein IV203_015094 [Nitzschia inconspicua]